MAERTPPTRTPLLDLDTLTVRPLVRIDGHPYELRRPEELSVLKNHLLNGWGKRIDELEQLEAPTPEDQTEYDGLLGQLCREVLLAPEEIQEQLQTPQRAAVALTFSHLRLQASLHAVGVLTEALKEQARGTPTTGAN